VRVAVLDDYQRVAATFADWSSLGPDVEVSYFHDHLGDPGAIVKALQEFDVVCLMRERTVLDADMISGLPRLRLIVTTGMVNASLDIAAASAHGVVVSGTDVSGPETAEHAWLLIAMLLNGLLSDIEGVRSGGQIAAYARSFGMNLLAWSQNVTDERAQERGAERAASLNDLFERSDIVSVHLKLSPRSRGLVAAEQLGLLGPDGYLVNTSRGPIVREPDLIEALRTGAIAGAALDTFDLEPLPADHPFRTEPRAIITPHTAYVSRESYIGMYGQTVEDIAAWLGGAPLRQLR
jgi:phosphoglycerate dehydrogenase-like enzyme